MKEQKKLYRAMTEQKANSEFFTNTFSWAQLRFLGVPPTEIKLFDRLSLGPLRHLARGLW